MFFRGPKREGAVDERKKTRARKKKHKPEANMERPKTLNTKLCLREGVSSSSTKRPSLSWPCSLFVSCISNVGKIALPDSYTCTGWLEKQCHHKVVSSHTVFHQSIAYWGDAGSCLTCTGGVRGAVGDGDARLVRARTTRTGGDSRAGSRSERTRRFGIGGGRNRSDRGLIDGIGAVSTVACGGGSGRGTMFCVGCPMWNASDLYCATWMLLLYFMHCAKCEVHCMLFVVGVDGWCWCWCWYW